MNVRRIGLDRFGIGNIPVGSPMSQLENVFLPLYLHHRYQLTAAVKTIGGAYYTHSVRSAVGPEPAPVVAIVPAESQREALKAVLETLKPGELVISERIVKLLPPVAYGYSSGRSELFAKRTSPIFDSIGAAEIAADMAISGLLEPNRAARMITFNARNRANPHFREIVDALIKATWRSPLPADASEAAIARAVQSLTVSRLMDAAANANAQPQVRAVATEALRQLHAALRRTPATGDGAAHVRATAEDIERFLARPDAPRRQTMPLPNPPGDPIGN